VTYKKKIIIFGGEKYNIHTQQRYAINEIRVFDPETVTWATVPGASEYIDPRRSHACCLVGKNMIIHGGIDTADTTKCDLWTFNVEHMKWNGVMSEGRELPLSHHTISGAYTSSMETMEIFTQIDVQATRPIRGSAIFKEGVFIFGGKDPNGKARGELYVISTEVKKKYAIDRIEPVGKPPHPRYGHSMVYWHSKQYLVIYGGRNDDLWEETGSSSMTDVIVLNLYYLVWCHVKIPNGQNPRYGMSTFLDGSTLYIIGGFSTDSFAKGVVEKLEINEDAVPDFGFDTENERIVDTLSYQQLNKISHFKVITKCLNAALDDAGLNKAFDGNRFQKRSSTRILHPENLSSSVDAHVKFEGDRRSSNAPHLGDFSRINSLINLGKGNKGGGKEELGSNGNYIVKTRKEKSSNMVLQQNGKNI
jgi:hypothetical protein